MSSRPPRRQVTNGSAQHSYTADDVEAGLTAVRKRQRFRDAVNLATSNQFHAELKQKLRSSVQDHDESERQRKSIDDIKKIKSKKLKAFYEGQNDRINDRVEVDAIILSMADDVLDSMHPRDVDGDGVAEEGGMLKVTKGDISPLLPKDEQEKRKKGARRAKYAININVIANILLVAAKAIATVSSSSLSLIASLVDSVLDLLCTMIIWTTNKLVLLRIQHLQYKFPVGRRRLEPLGIVVFSIIMIVSFLQVLKESFEKLMPSDEPHVAEPLPPTAIAALAATVVVKGIIWIGCARIKTTQVQALAQDCKTDVVFNTLSLLFPLLGGVLGFWWLDPVGALLLSLYIVYDWSMTLLENVARLSGSAVDDRLLKKITFMAWRFNPVVSAYKSVMAYHAGDGIWVEVDLLMEENTHLGKAHDVAETLQYCLEGLNEVDRAFVSVDYTSQGPTGHVPT